MGQAAHSVSTSALFGVWEERARPRIAKENRAMRALQTPTTLQLSPVCLSECMHLCVCVCVCACVRARICVSMSAWANVRVHTCGDLGITQGCTRALNGSLCRLRSLLGALGIASRVGCRDAAHLQAHNRTGEEDC